MGDETLQKGMAAKALGMDPRIAFLEPSDPPETLKEYDPDSYYKQKYEADSIRKEKARLDEYFGKIKSQSSQQFNEALFAKARVTHDLNDQQLGQVQEFIQNRIQPGAGGLYTDDDLSLAVTALFGVERAGKAKLESTEKIRTTIKKAGSSTSPAASPKPPKLTKEQKERQEFHEFVKVAQ